MNKLEAILAELEIETINAENIVNEMLADFPDDEFDIDEVEND